MIRPTLPADTPELLDISQQTGVFKPLEIQALREVLDDYHAENHEMFGHRSVTYERDGRLLGFAYYAPAAMTVGTWHLWWIVVCKDLQARGLGTELLKFVEHDVAAQNGRVMFIETGSLPHYDPTRRFYLKHGYEQHAVLKDFYDAGDSQVVFRKGFV